MKNDAHTQAIPAEILQQVQSRISEISVFLAPYCLALTSSERQEILKMGEKSLAFVEKAHEFAMQNPMLRPPYLDMSAYDADFADAHGLWAIQNAVRQIDELIADTAMTAGSEAFHTSLVFYNSVKIAAQQDVPGAKAVYEELRKRFPRGKKKTTIVNSEQMNTL